MNKSASEIQRAVGLGGAHGLYTLAAIASLAFVWIAAPDTKDKTVEEM
jgi:hypothetical protein